MINSAHAAQLMQVAQAMWQNLHAHKHRFCNQFGCRYQLSNLRVYVYVEDLCALWHMPTKAEVLKLLRCLLWVEELDFERCSTVVEKMVSFGLAYVTPDRRWAYTRGRCIWCFGLHTLWAALC